MSYDVKYTAPFEKSLKRLMKRYKSVAEDVNEVVLSLSDNPFQGVDLGGGLRKIRMAIKSKGKGKSGGARIITYNVVLSEHDGIVELLTIYDKSDRENISDKELESIVKQLGIL